MLQTAGHAQRNQAEGAAAAGRSSPQVPALPEATASSRAASPRRRNAEKGDLLSLVFSSQ